MQGGQGVDCDNLPPLPGESIEGDDSADSVETVGLAASASDTTGPLASYSAGTAGSTGGGVGAAAGTAAGTGQKGSPIPWAPYQQQQAPGDAAAADGGADDGEDVDTKIEQLRAVAGLLLDKAEELEQRL